MPEGDTLRQAEQRIAPLLEGEHLEHVWFRRSLVLAPEEVLRFTVLDDRSVVLTADGRELGELAAGDSVSCRGGDRSARIVTFGPRDFHQILKAKFGLADR